MKRLTAVLHSALLSYVTAILLQFVYFSPAFCQWNATQQKAINAYVDYANQSASEIQTVVESIKNYYPALQNQDAWNQPRYICPVQMDEYYYKTALVSSQQLKPATAAILNTRLNALRDVASAIDFKCKELDTYHKLQDYDRDHFAKARLIIESLEELSKQYRDAQASLQRSLLETWGQFPAKGDYATAAQLMRKVIQHDRNFIGLLQLNLNESVHTGWADDKILSSIHDSDSLLSALNAMSPSLKYPASSMWDSFKQSVTDMIKAKERGLDQYNFEAKKSDRHSNYRYMDLINYFNGTLVSNYNTFVQFSERDQQYNIKMINYAPVFEIRTELKPTTVSIHEYEAITDRQLPTNNPSAPIKAEEFTTLSEYINFINEGARQVRYMQMVMTSFNSSASYFKALQSYENRAPMHFSYAEFNIPYSFFYRAVAKSKNLRPADAEVLNGKLQTLLNILTEMDQHGASIDVQVKGKLYEADKLESIYRSFERLQILFEHWDEHKELLYTDVRTLFDIYPSTNQENPWFISGMDLHELLVLDYKSLKDARRYYKGDTLVEISTALIDTAVRQVIANEFQNMKDIPKYGRNNGNCPYTPYEDLAAASRRYSEQLKKVKSGIRHGYRHPYNDFVDRYNDIVDDYNSFAELSKDVPLLQAVKQTELFFIKYPDEKKTPLMPSSVAVQTTKYKDKKEPSTSPAVIRDTVYIERHDTIYVGEEIDYSSMDGFALNNLVLLIDVSASMNSPEKLPLLKTTLMDMLPVMREDDQLSIVAVAGSARVVLEATSFKNKDLIEKAISELSSEGKTMIAPGLKLAFKVADERYIRGGNNRVILATDGEFPVTSSLTKLVKGFQKKDISLSVFNFGKAAAESLRTLAATGNGNYSSISADNAKKTLFREAKARRIK